MGKNLLFWCLVVGLFGCGQKSTIKKAIEAHTFAQSDGCDGVHICRNLSLSIVPDPFDSPIPKVGVATPLVGGLAKLLMGIGLIEGTRKFSLNQPVPLLPDEFISSLKLSRVFFVIEEENFDFIRKVAVMVTPKPIQNQYGILTTSPTKESVLSSKEEEKYFSLFDDKSIFGQMDNLSNEKNVVVLKYDQENDLETNINKYTHTKDLSYVYILKTGQPALLMKHIRDTLNYKNQLRHKEILGEDSLLIELKPDPAAKAAFDQDLKKFALDPELDYKDFVKCTPRTCLDIKVSERNILPLVIKENSLQIDAVVDVGSAPKAFRLKGYIQFAIKVLPPKGI